MKKYYLTYFICVVGIILQACQQKTLVPQSYTPEDKAKIVSVRNDGTVKILVEHIPDARQHSVFDVEVINNSKKVIKINPHNFCAYGSDNGFLTPAEDTLDIYQQSFMHANVEFRGIHALTEKQVNRAIKRKITTQKIVGAALIVASTAVIVHDAVQDSKDVQSELWTLRDQRKADRREFFTASSLVTMDMIRAGMAYSNEKKYEDLQYLPEEYLHSILLFPGESIRGKVFFTSLPTSYVRLVLPAGETRFVVDMKRLRIK